MEISVAQGKIEGIKRSAKIVHSKMLSNGIEVEGADDLFEKIDGKLQSVIVNIYDVHDIEIIKGEYFAPKVGPEFRDERIKEDTWRDNLKSGLTEIKVSLEKLQKDWKEEKYKVVNHQNNGIAYLNNTNRGNITKVVVDIDSLIDKL